MSTFFAAIFAALCAAVVSTQAFNVVSSLKAGSVITSTVGDATPMANFTIEPYMGVWYEYARVQNIWETGLKCDTATYKLLADGGVDIINEGTRILPFPKKKSTIHGVGRRADAQNAPASKLVVKFNNVPADANYWVLDTDYTSYTVVYSPLPSGGANAWILTRQAEPDSDTTHKAINILAAQTGILNNALVYPKQNC